MREPKTIFYGVPSYQWPPQDVTTPDLLREMTTLARMNYFLWDPREAPVADKMRQNYGALWCNGELPPLVTESRARAKAGDADCRAFWAAIDSDPVFTSARPHQTGSEHEKDANTLINQVHDLIRKYPAIRQHYGRVDPDNALNRLDRPPEHRPARPEVAPAGAA
jgi:hypothetical protein